MPKTLQHLAALKSTENLAIEIVIVDNASTDNTAQVSLNLWQSFGAPHELKVVEEPTPGLTHARVCGVRESRYEIIIFCDDDNWLCPNYAQTAFQLLVENPQIALAGGPAEAIFESSSVPAWFRKVEGVYAIGGDEGACEVPKDGILRGAGMVARKSQLIDLFSSGFTFICSDRKGTSLSSGGDLEICHAMRWLGYVLYHDGQLRLGHFIPEARLTWNYVVDACKGFGGATIATDPIRLIEMRDQPFRNYIRMSFVYQIMRGAISLLPLIWSLLSMYRSEGNVEVLKAASKLGRLKAVIDLNFSYRNVVATKVAWLEQNSANAGEIGKKKLM